MCSINKAPVRIQVGASRSHALTENIQQQPSAKQVDVFENSDTTMSELCDKSYTLKRGIKRKMGAAKAPETNEASNRKAEQRRIAAATANAAVDATGPRVEIINGKIVVKESSLVINNANQNADADYEEVVEGIHATATYSSFLKRRPSPKWGLEETRLFYKALRQCGTEFTFMQAFFPGRTRDQLKKKFYREEHQHPELIKRCLDTQLPLELTPFEAQLGTIDGFDGNDNDNDSVDVDKVSENGEELEELEQGQTKPENTKNKKTKKQKADKTASRKIVVIREDSESAPVVIVPPQINNNNGRVIEV